MIVYNIQSISKTYPGQDRPANDNITLQIQAGEIFGLLGDNGAGKSTLVRQMANLIAPDNGSIQLFGQPVNSNNPLHAACLIGYMPQDALTMNQLTVGEALYFTAHLRGLSRPRSIAERDRLLEILGIQSLCNQPNSHLSGGQKRLLNLGVALAGSPPVLLLDEPTNNLDPQHRQLVWDTIRHLNHSQGVTVIFITHDAIEAEKIIQRVGIMHNGRIVACGRPSDLKAQVDQQLRLELFFSQAHPPRLPDELTPRQIDAGRWLVYIPRSEAGALLSNLDLNEIDDFRLYSATLEDLYLHYAHIA